MKFSIIAMMASVSAIQISGPAVGNANPRFCDLGASSKDSNSQGC